MVYQGRLTDRELSAVLKQLHQLKKKKDEIGQDIEHLHDALRAHLAAIGADELTQAGYIISNKLVITSTIDTKAMKAELPELVARYTRSKEGRRFFVRAVV